MTYETPIEPTLGQVMKRINLVRKDLAKKLANTPQREWDAEPVREMCNHEKELHTALMVLRDLAGDQGAFAGGAMKEPVAVPQAFAALTLSADPLPAMPPQSIAYWLGIDVGGETPAYCVMVAYRSESDARSAMATLSAAPAVGALSQAAQDVLAERRRQIEAEGCTAEHDDVFQGSELALAAAWYATPPFTRFALDANDMSLWPLSWLPTSFKPGDRRQELVKSSALSIAELERLDRAAATSTAEGA